MFLYLITRSFIINKYLYFIFKKNILIKKNYFILNYYFI